MLVVSTKLFPSSWHLAIVFGLRPAHGGGAVVEPPVTVLVVVAVVVVVVVAVLHLEDGVVYGGGAPPRLLPEAGDTRHRAVQRLEGGAPR